MVGRGGNNLNIEAVQTRGDMRGKGIGAAMFRFAIERAGRPAPGSSSFTSNNARTDAHRFYARMGFVHSHAGFKMKLR